MGVYELQLSNDKVRASCAKLPFDELRLPESWVPHCRVLEDNANELRLELADEPPRAIKCSMVENGRELVVRVIQRGNRIFPVHGIVDDEERCLSSDRYFREKALRKVIPVPCVSLAIPALLLGVFRLLRFRYAGKRASPAIWQMLLADAVAFLLCGAWKYTHWACVAAVLVVVCLCADCAEGTWFSR